MTSHMESLDAVSGRAWPGDPCLKIKHPLGNGEGRGWVSAVLLSQGSVLELLWHPLRENSLGLPPGGQRLTHDAERGGHLRANDVNDGHEP